MFGPKFKDFCPKFQTLSQDKIEDFKYGNSILKLQFKNTQFRQFHSKI